MGQIARERTLLSYYAPFLSKSLLNGAIESMRSESVAHLKFRLGILTSRFRANHPLKACPKCMGESVRTFGWSCWLVDHQQPGVWMCQLHEEPLLTCMVKANGVERFSWQLPDAEALQREWTSCTTAELDAHFRLSSFFQELRTRDLEPGVLEHVSVQRVFLRRLNKLGFMTRGGSVRIKDLSDLYAEHCRPLRVVPELAALPQSPNEAASEVGRLVHSTRSCTHPIRLLAFASWLFSDAKALFESLVDKSEPSTELPDPVQATDNPRRATFLKLIGHGKSVRKASEIVGIATNTGLAWAAANGAAVGARPKVLKPDIKASLLKLLREGVDRVAAADAVGVAVGTIDRLFQRESGLHAEWRDARRARAQEAARETWARALAECSIKLARALEPAAYAWLYRNDRNWLESTCATLPRRQAPRQTAVNWMDRDMTLAEQVRQALLKLSVGATKRVRLWQVCQAIPELKAKLGHLSQLPLTRKALEHAISAHSPRDEGTKEFRWD